jgi:glycyl-tRNA synthetase beta chain
MQSHQKYFPLVDGDGRLRANFITVSNIESRDPQQVIAGNERVIRPRLADAAFFFAQDLQQSLASRLERLAAWCSRRNSGIRAGQDAADPASGGRVGRDHSAPTVNRLNVPANCAKPTWCRIWCSSLRTCRVSPAPTTPAMTARMAVVADAIAQHYRPRSAGSDLPEATSPGAVALADRLDTLLGIFGIGQPPSGSKDPFALRRASIAVLRLSIEGGHDLDLQQLLAAAGNAYPEGLLEDGTQQTVFDYILDRSAVVLRGRGDTRGSTARRARHGDQ